MTAARLAALAFAGFALAAPAGAFADPPQTGFERSNGASWTTYDDEQAFIKAVDAASPRVGVQKIGTTKQGRTLNLVVLGAPAPRTSAAARHEPTILFTCSQHGNEPAGREACLTTLRNLAFSDDADTLTLLEHSTVLFVPAANPDGRAANTRGNSNGTDINRDHITLATPEAQAVAGVVRLWQPDVSIDLHEYGPSQPVLYDDDVLYLWPRNLNTDQQVHDLAEDLGRNYIKAGAQAAGYTADEYGQQAVGDTDVAQTAGDADEGIARNLMGLRNVLGILVETRVDADPVLDPMELADDAAVNRRRVESHLTVIGIAFRFMRERGDEAAAVTAGARPNPQLDITPEYNRDAIAGEDPWTRGFSLAIPVDFSGKRRAQLAVAIAKAEQARLEYVDSAWAVRREVREALVGHLTPAPSLQAQAAAQAERVRLMQRRVDVGLAGRPDLTQARLTQQGLEVESAQARQEKESAHIALAAAIGIPVNALPADVSLELVSQPPAFEALPPSDRQRFGLLHRPDVLAALAGYDAAEANLRLEVARQYPDLTLDPGLLWDAGDAKWTLGLSLVLPLLNRNQGPIAEAKAQREAAAARVVQVQAKALGELEQARAAYATSMQALRAADAGLESANSVLRAAQRAQVAGTGIRSDVLGAQAELSAAQARRARALMGTERALGALEDAMRVSIVGGPFHPDDAIRELPGVTEP
jgi:outer membrane protein TolC